MMCRKDKVSLMLAPYLCDDVISIVTAYSEMLIGETFRVVSHEDTVRGLVPFGEGFASGSLDAIIKVWNSAGELVAELLGHAWGITLLVVRTDGKLVSGSIDGGMIVWEGSAPCMHLRGHTSGITALTTLPNSQIASGSYDKKIMIWNDVGTCTRILDSHKQAPYFIAAFRGAIVSRSWDETWRISGGSAPQKVIRRETRARIFVDAVSDVGDILCGDGNSLEKWNPMTKAQSMIQQFPNKITQVRCFPFFGNFTLIVISGEVVYVLDSNGSILATVLCPDACDAILLSNSMVAVSCYGREIRIFQ